MVKVPKPEDDHSAEFAEPPIVPLVVKTSLEQISSSTPALTITPALIVRTITSVAAEHTPIGSSVVRVNTTEPAAISPAEGV